MIWVWLFDVFWVVIDYFVYSIWFVVKCFVVEWFGLLIVGSVLDGVLILVVCFV